MQIPAPNKNDFWEKLQPFTSENYVGESLDPLVAVAILKLWDAGVSTSMESIADTVLNISLRQLAVKRIEDGTVDILEENRKDEEIELERKILEEKYGKQIHQHLRATYGHEKFN